MKEEEIKKQNALFATTCFGIDSLNSTVCSGRGNCTATDTCVCNAGFQNVPPLLACQTACPSLTFRSINVPLTSDRVDVSFNQYLNPTTVTNCKNGIANIISAGFLPKFGVGATCLSTSPSTLTFFFGANVNISQNDQFTFLPNAVQAVGGCGNFYTNPISFSTVTFPDPVPILSGPNQISICSQTFLLDGSASTGVYTTGWSMDNNGNGDYNATLDNLLQALPKNVTKVNLLSDYFTIGVVSTIKFTLTNIFDQTTVSRSLNIIRNSFESPIVVINCAGAYDLTKAAQFTASAVASCGRTGLTFTYQWASDFGGSTSNFLSVPANSYKLNKNYNVTVQVNQFLNGVNFGNATAQCDFTTVAPNPTARTTNDGTTVSVKSGVQFTVDGSSSSDPAGQALYYNWTCCTLTTSGCDVSNCVQNFPTIGVTYTNKFTATANATGYFAFFLTVTTADQRTSTTRGETYNIIPASQTVVLSSSLTVQTSTVAVCVIRTPAAVTDTFAWTVSNGDITLPSVTTTACIYPLISNIRADTTLSVQVTSGGQNYQLFVTVPAPFTPKGGSGTVLNQDNSVATFPLSQSSNYVLSAPSWTGSGQNTLQYTFSILDANSNSVFQATSLSSTVALSSVALPKTTTQATYTVSISIVDTSSTILIKLPATFTFSITIGAFSLGSNTAETAATSLLSSVQSCTTGDVSCLVNGLSSVATVLNLNSVKGGATRQNIVSQSLTLITNNLATLNSLGRNYVADLLPALSSLGSNPQDLTPTASSSVISLLTSSFAQPSASLSTTQVTAVFNTLSNCFKSLTTTTSFLLQQNANQAAAVNTRTILKKIALGVETDPGTNKDYSSTDYGVTVFRYGSASQVPTTTISNTYFKFTPPALNLPATNAPIDFIVTRFQTGYFYGNNYVNNSFPTIGFEFISKDTNNIIPVQNLPNVIEFVISGNGPNSNCMYLDTTSQTWKSDGVGTIDTNNGLRCNTTHLTEFTGFAIYDAGTTNPPANNNNLYYLLLLLLIFPICLIFAVIIGFVGFTCFKIFQGRLNINLFKKGLGGNKTGGAGVVTTDKDKDMIDLGI